MKYLLSTLLFIFYFISFLSAQPLIFTGYDTRKGNKFSNPHNFTTINGKLFFIAVTDDNTYQPWISDGTIAGTTQLTNKTPGMQYYTLSNVAVLNGYVYFFASDDKKCEMWRTDGTAAGTMKYVDLSNDTLFAFGYPVVCGNKIYYHSLDSFFVRRLYVTDGGSSGVSKLMNLNEYTPLFAFKDKVYFQHDDGIHGKELWVSDGTGTGTHLFKDINTGSSSSYPNSFYVMDNKMYLKGTTDVYGTELWVTDGTSQGTFMVADVAPGNKSGTTYSAVTSLNGKLYFAGDDGVHGSELFTSDGTAAGTYLVKDITPGSIGCGITAIHVYNNKIYFSGCSSSSNFEKELWVSDGTGNGTFLLKDINPNSNLGLPHSSNPSSFIEFDNKLYFIASPTSNNYQICRTDGTSAGTEAIYNTSSNAINPVINGLYKYNDALYFYAEYDSTIGADLWSIRSLWKTNVNTSPNSELVISIAPNPAHNNFAIKTNIAFKQGSVTLIDITGKLVKTQSLTANTPIPLNGIAPGVYMADVLLDDKRSMQRLVVE